MERQRDNPMTPRTGRNLRRGERSLWVLGALLSGCWAGVWLAWLFVHIFFLIGFRNRLLVMIQWAWSYLTYERGACLITGSDKLPGWNQPRLKSQPPPDADGTTEPFVPVGQRRA